MRSFIISVILLLLVMGTWFGFDMYSENELDKYLSSIDTEIMLNIKEENWQEAADALEKLQNDWHKYRKYAEFFLETTELNEISYTMTKSKAYIENEDAASAAGELSYLRDQIRFLDVDESISSGNIF